MASAGSSPSRASSSNDRPVTSSAFGSALRLIGFSSHENVSVVSNTRQAPIDSRLNSPGIGPAVSTSTEMKTSRFLAHGIRGSVGTRGGRLRIACQCSRNARRRSSAHPVVFQCRPDKVVMSNGWLAPSRAITIVGKPAAQSISEFEKAVGPRAGDVGKDDATAVQLGEYLLVDAGVLDRPAAVDHDETIAQLAFDHWLNHDIEKFLHVSKFGQSGLSSRTANAFGLSSDSKSSTRALKPARKPLAGRKTDAVDPVMRIAIIGDLEQPPRLIAGQPEIVKPPRTCVSGQSGRLSGTTGLPAS